MRIGTCNFPTIQNAYRYYMPEANNSMREAIKLVAQKLNEKSITIGIPIVKTGEKLVIQDNRYFICDINE